jgi:hypothetical protein
MSCLTCASTDQREFGTEILVHFPGLKNLEQTSRLGISPNSWSVWIVGFRGLPPRRKNWQYLQEVRRELNLIRWKDPTCRAPSQE